MRWLRQIEQHSPEVGVVATTDPARACLLVATCGDSHEGARPQCHQAFTKASSWAGGANHYVWRSNYCHHPDQPFDTGVPNGAAAGWRLFVPGRAALASTSMMPGQALHHFDTPLHLRPRLTLTAAERAAATDRHHRRPLLLSFRGNIFPWRQKWWQHRWLAAEYLHDPQNGVWIDVQCAGPDGRQKPYSGGGGATGEGARAHRDRYAALLLNSTFVFAPGGGGPHSYRFGEALAAGAVPVVPTDVLLPFEPEVRWEACVVRVTEGRIVDLPQTLRAMPTTDVAARRTACEALYHTVVGHKRDKAAFRLALRLWVLRVRAQIAQQYIATQLLVPPPSRAPSTDDAVADDA